MRRHTAPFLLLAALLATPALAQAPARTSGRASGGSGYQGAAGWAWFATGADLRRCTDTSAATLRGAGYVVDRVAPDEDAVVAGRDGNFLLVTCITRHGVVSVAWNGRDPEGSRAVIRQLNAALGDSRGAAGPGAAAAPPARSAPANSAPVGQVGSPPVPTPRGDLPLKPR